MSWLDLVILGIIALSALISLVRGFVKEFVSLVTWIVAGVIALRYFSPMAQLLEPFIAAPMVRNVVGFALLFIATLIIGAIVNFILSQLVSKTGLSGTDKALGVVFWGSARRINRYHGGVTRQPDADAGSELVAGVGHGRLFSANCRLGQRDHTGRRSWQIPALIRSGSKYVWDCRDI